MLLNWLGQFAQNCQNIDISEILDTSDGNLGFKYMALLKTDLTDSNNTLKWWFRLEGAMEINQTCGQIKNAQNSTNC